MTGYRSRFLARTAIVAWAASLPVTAALAAEPLTYFTWAGYDDPAFRQPFIEKYGPESVSFAFFSSPDEAFAKLKAGFKADVAHSCIHDINKWKDAGLIKPIDTSRLQTWNDLIPAPARRACRPHRGPAVDGPVGMGRVLGDLPGR
jgi:spermidine/putrescine-binding protein